MSHTIDERCFLFVQALKPKIRSQLKLTPHWLKLEGDNLALNGTMEDVNEFVRLAFKRETALQEADGSGVCENEHSCFYRRAKALRINALRQTLLEKIKSHISPAERKQRFRDRACLACGDKTHRLRDCPSSLAKELRTNAVSLSADTSPPPTPLRHQALPHRPRCPWSRSLRRSTPRPSSRPCSPPSTAINASTRNSPR